MHFFPRQLKRYHDEDSSTLVSTIKVMAGEEPYETAVEHPAFNNGKLVVVEGYSSRKEAIEGHYKWVAIMTHAELPDKLVDAQNSPISQILALLDPESIEYENMEE